MPITGGGRLMWALNSTIGPGSLFIGALQAGWGNLTDRPPEYREGMEGFGKRFGLRLSSVGTSNVMEASLGAIWGEDPRFRPVQEQQCGGHFAHALKMTFMAQRSDGSLAPAYARYIAYAGSNAISDAWRPDSQLNGVKHDEPHRRGIRGPAVGEHVGRILAVTEEAHVLE